jgi:Rad3-related DNA helicase
MADDHQALREAFPYPPYDIQQQFMINVVETLENRQIGLFESPTGAWV